MGKNNRNIGNQRKGKKNSSDQKIEFINPYNFIPIPEEIPERRDNIKGNDTLSGSLTCHLDVKSSLFIPNTSKKFSYYVGEKEHYFSEFFSYEDLSGMKDEIPEYPPKYPRIPGSELRGMVRNVYEQLTNSCFSIIDDKNVTKEIGLLDFSTNKVYRGERIFLNTKKGIEGKQVKIGAKKEEFHTGDNVCIEKNNKDEKPYVTEIKKKESYLRNCENYEDGVVLIGTGYSTRKSYESVIVKCGDETVCKVKSEDMDSFQKMIDEYAKEEKKNEKENTHQRYADTFKKLREKKNGVFPVFYETKGENCHISSAVFTREMLSANIIEMLKNSGRHECCTGEDGWCPACRLFGMIGRGGKEGEKGKAIASRLRFTDSEPIENVKFGSPKILGILGTPQYFTTEFYLHGQEEKGMWEESFALKGRKVYMLGEDKGKNQVSSPAVVYAEKNPDEQLFSKQRGAVRALTKGYTTFQIFFEHLTREELDCLIFSLTLGDEGNGLYHRIGKGKPFGMGAVKVRVEELKLISYAFKDGKIEREYRTEDVQNYGLRKEDYEKKYEKAMENIALYSIELKDGNEKIVRYPLKTKGEKKALFNLCLHGESYQCASKKGK